MCAIAGILGLPGQPIHESTLWAMADAMAHRGPDDRGLWVNAEIGLSHRRLAIVQPGPAGAQPMHSRDGRWVVVFNGELYNHLDVRRQHGLSGVYGHSDTKTLVERIAQVGVAKAIHAFEGMFALAAWDRHTRTLHLARDRFGIKPLYYAATQGGFAFASELRGLLHWPLLDRELDPLAICDLLALGYIPSPRAIYQQVRKLQPGTLLTVTPQGAPQTTRYWSAFEVATTARSRGWHRSREQAFEAVASRLRHVVTARTMADVPVGALLSGGIDSSVVVASLVGQGHPVHTFSLGSTHPHYDETPYASQVAKQLGTVHHQIRITDAKAQALVPQLASIWDEPFADSSQLPTWLVCQFAREQVGVVLSGDGGDEVFGGYAHYLLAYRYLAGLTKLPSIARRLLAGAIRRLPTPVWQQLGQAIARVRGQQGVSRLPIKRAKLAAVLGAHPTFDPYPTLIQPGLLGTWMAHRDWQPLALASDTTTAHHTLSIAEQWMLYDTVGYLEGDILTKVDRASMAVGLEARVPLLDHHLFELAWRLPAAFKLGGEGKTPLRHALYKHAPKQLFNRPKHGFSVPVGPWLQGPLRDWAESLLTPSSLDALGLDATQVGAVWTAHQQGRADYGARLWPVLMLVAWWQAQHA